MQMLSFMQSLTFCDKFTRTKKKLTKKSQRLAKKDFKGDGTASE